MVKELKGFMTRDDFIIAANNQVAPVFELSNIAYTYSLQRKQYYSATNSLYSLHAFNLVGTEELLQSEVEVITDVVVKFTTFLTTNQITNKQQTLILFTNNFNAQFPNTPISDLTYNDTVNYNTIKAPDYLSFKIQDINCTIWLSDSVFRTFYPHYDIRIVLPMENFASIVNNTSDFIAALEAMNLMEFNKRIEENKNNAPTTYTKIINIPYRVPNTTVTKNCYFAFNIYGLQGNYDYILKLELYNYLVNTLGLNGEFIESIFPSILNINEFFIVPRWDKVAISAQVGEIGINSQISRTYNETFDQNKFIKIYTNDTYLANNTYNVPFDYNNVLLQVTNGYYTDMDVKDFRSYYNDFITVTSTHPDFARMKTRTQRFISLLENMLDVCNSNNATELFNKVLQNKDYRFTIITRAGVSYLSIFYEDHQYYVIPKYQFMLVA
jgi:hypothetical protein